MDFVHVGRVRHLRPEDGFIINALAGELALVLCDAEAGPVVAYFDAKRRPKIGTRVGVCGRWVQTREAASFGTTPPGFPLALRARRVEEQVQVANWVRVSDD